MDIINPTKDYNKINIRKSHPNLFWSVFIFALINIGLGLNFLLFRPTFNPYEFDKAITGSIFLCLGISKIVFLTVSRNLKMVRITMFLEVVFFIFWGIGTSITGFLGTTSFQLFVLYMGMAAIEARLLSEPVINPLTKKE